MSRKIIDIITAITGDPVIIGETELLHVLERHRFTLLIARGLVRTVLTDPSDIFTEDTGYFRKNLYFYRKEGTRYFLVVVKKDQAGSYFSSLYTTGSRIKQKHLMFRRIK